MRVRLRHLGTIRPAHGRKFGTKTAVATAIAALTALLIALITSAAGSAVVAMAPHFMPRG
jgi:hypothetical protein